MRPLDGGSRRPHGYPTRAPHPLHTWRALKRVARPISPTRGAGSRTHSGCRTASRGAARKSRRSLAPLRAPRALLAERGVTPPVLASCLLWRLAVVVQAHSLRHARAVAARLAACRARMRSALEHFAQHQRVVEGSLQTEQRALAPPCHPTTSRMSMSECWPLQTRGERRSPGEYGEAAGRLLEGAPRADELAPGEPTERGTPDSAISCLAWRVPSEITGPRRSRESGRRPRH